MTDPTLATVADKTIDHVTAGIKALADTMQKAAPHVWEVALTSSPRCAADRASKGIPSSRQEFPASTLAAPDSE